MTLKTEKATKVQQRTVETWMDGWTSRQTDNFLGQYPILHRTRVVLSTSFPIIPLAECDNRDEGASHVLCGARPYVILDFAIRDIILWTVEIT
jgi:hypothetical protein